MFSKIVPLVLVLLVTSSVGFGQGIKTIIIEGVPALDGNGTFGRDLPGPTFDKVVINESGQAAFTGRMRGTVNGFFDQQGLFLYEPETDEVLQIARAGQKAPGTVGNFMSFEGGSTLAKPFLSLNDSGNIAMYATATGDVNFPTMSGVGPYLFSKEAIINIAMEGGPDPRNLGTIKSFAFIALANNGQMAFPGRVEIDIFTIPPGMFVTDASDNSLKTIFMLGDTIPGTSDAVVSFDFRGVNNTGYSVLLGDDSDGDNGEPGKQDVWLVSKDSFERVVNDGDAVPGGNGVFDEVTFADINDNNDIVFIAQLAETAGGLVDDLGLFLKDGEGLHRLAQDGAVSVADIPLGAYGTPRINNQGQIAFQATSNVNNFRGIFLLTKTGGRTLVIHGQALPDGSGTFSFSSSTAAPQMWLNDSGQVLFQGNGGAFVVDAEGNINQVVRVGQALEGSTVTEIDIVGAGSIQDAGLGYGNQRPMNNSGQVVFWAELEDGRDGIFMWNGPPPPLPDPEIESISADGNDVVVSLDTGVGATYQLRRNSAPEVDGWVNEGTAADGTGDTIELRHPNALPIDKRFYDVLITSPDS